MRIASSGTPKKEGREFQSLLAASLISRFEKISDEEVYDKASRCFDFLLDVRESREAAKKLALLTDRAIPSLQQAAGSVIDRLLFNRNNDPYVSLGLPPYAGKSEAKDRWKRLIVLYHPDKYPNQREYEERAKKINEAYEEIRKEAKMCNSRDIVTHTSMANPLQSETALYRRHLKRVPTFTLALAIFIVVLSILLFINAY
ncbi:MAG: J domain-containing protein [Nitrospiraceae bacterium]|nr:J domain-containing protein [Nitrospiraceae bacterium]